MNIQFERDYLYIHYVAEKSFYITLCGGCMSYDSWEETEKEIDCPNCLAIIKECKELII